MNSAEASSGASFLLRSFTEFTERVKGAMEKLCLEWELCDCQNGAVQRHCPNCGRKVWFTDSRQRRHNANGKQIYEYAIYKCENGHTWNRKIGSYSARSRAEGPVRDEAVRPGEFSAETLRVEHCLKRGVPEVAIALRAVRGSWRLDKLLARQIEDWSRERIVSAIEEGRILLDHAVVKPRTLVRTGQVIRILLAAPHSSGDLP
ncbi:hypothetical protein EDC14_100373 [Hydrogenispora ethanolica]|uniref:RNA-binding S4 domain-containing protein n=2 Tax=Hydrogenispora ethanolica TaxID=1082276 RepID=A0A4R1S9F2_HYDET|nr:hypothetical protein EDC14_100373 [Hydrogenispora ethanolica]